MTDEAIHNILDYQPNMDGKNDDSYSIQRMIRAVCSEGGTGIIGAGTYRMDKGVSAGLSASCKFDVSPNAKFVAGHGFPAQRMFFIATGSGSEHVFEWVGGQFDGTNQPKSLSGQANDIFSFNALNSDSVKIILHRTYSGPDWMLTGSDSHLMIGGASNVHAEIRSAQGAADTAIYISSDFTGNIGQNVYATGNFLRCACGIIIKRRFENATIDASVMECRTGAAIGVADTTGEIIVEGGNGFNINVNAYRCQEAVSVQGGSVGIVNVVARQMGVSIPRYVSGASRALQISGGRNLIANVVARGVNPGCARNANFVGVNIEDRLINGVVWGAMDNHVTANVMELGRSVREVGSDRNFISMREHLCTDAPIINGPNTVFQRHAA